MKLFSINTGNFKLDGGAMFGVVPKVLWEPLYPADENNLCNWSMRSLLIDTGERRILLDTGIGDKQDAKFFSHYYLNGDDTMEKSLATAGYTTTDITDVILSHLHFDHCGGTIKYNADRTVLEPTFPNASVWVSRRQWEWAMKPNRRERASFFKENILPIQECGQLQFIEQDTELYPGVTVRLFNGHTDGQAITFVKAADITYVYVSDLICSAAHVPLSFIPGYDTRPLISLKEKQAFLEEAVKEKYTLFFLHDLYHECCTLKETEKGIRPDALFSLNSK